jgi:hypothetical protein
MKTSRLPSSADDFVPTWSCSRRGLPGHPHYCRCRWSFTPPFHHHLAPPSPPPNWGRVWVGVWLFVSVALIRQVSSSRRVPRPGCYPTPCSMECGLSSAPTTQDRDRPTDLRQRYHTRKDTERQPQWAGFKQFSYRLFHPCPTCVWRSVDLSILL